MHGDFRRKGESHESHAVALPGLPPGLPPGLDSGLLGPPGLPLGLDSGLLGPPGLDSGLLGPPGLDSGLLGPLGLYSGAAPSVLPVYPPGRFDRAPGDSWAGFWAPGASWAGFWAPGASWAGLDSGLLGPPGLDSGFLGFLGGFTGISAGIRGTKKILRKIVYRTRFSYQLPVVATLLPLVASCCRFDARWIPTPPMGRSTTWAGSRRP